MTIMHIVVRVLVRRTAIRYSYQDARLCYQAYCTVLYCLVLYYTSVDVLHMRQSHGKNGNRHDTPRCVESCSAFQGAALTEAGCKPMHRQARLRYKYLAAAGGG